MKLVSSSVSPESDYIEPALGIDLVFEFTRGMRVPLDVALSVRAEDGKVLGQAALRSRDTGDALPVNTEHQGGTPDAELRERTHLVLPLSSRQIDHLEQLRSRNRKGDVVFQLRIEAPCLVSKAVNTSFALLRPKQGGESDVFDVIYRYQNRFQASHTDMWVISGSNGRTFLQREIFRADTTALVHASDWLHDYSAPWNTTRYLVIELPIAGSEASAPTDELGEWVRAAIESVEKSRLSLSAGEWSDVVEGLRPVWEVTRGSTHIRDMLLADGYPSDAAEALMASISQQFTFASKFAHRTDKTGKQLRPEVTAAREDAHLVFAFASAFVGLLSRKYQRRTGPR